MAELAKKIDVLERNVLTTLYDGPAGVDGERGAFQYNTWLLPTRLMGSVLPSMKRRKLIDAEGRGNARQWWITELGKVSLLAARGATK